MPAQTNQKNGRPSQTDNRPNHLRIYPHLLHEGGIKTAENFNNQFKNKLIIKKSQMYEF